MTDDRSKAAPQTDEAASERLVDQPTDVQVAPRARGSLKDRIADLSIGAKATAARAGLAERMKAVQGAAPGADDIRNKIRGAAAAVRFDRLNRETLKAGRDGLAAKVEALLKPRPADDVAPGLASLPSAKAATTSGAFADQAVPVAQDSRAEPTTTPSRRNIGLLKARVEDALKGEPRVAEPAPEGQSGATAFSPVTTDAAQDGRQPSHPTRSVTFTPRTQAPAASPQSATASTDPTGPDDVAVADPATERTRSFNTARIVKAEAEAERGRPVFTLGMFATALTAGGVLHILTTFAVPWMNASSAFERLRDKLETNAMRVFPAEASGQTPLPFLSADLR
jgi:hypothetical protein